MSWYTKLKMASPYSMNLCPHCSECLNIDFLWEKGLKRAEAVGKCPYCGTPFRIQESNEQEMMNFNYSSLVEIDEDEFVILAQENEVPVLIVTQDPDHNCVTQ